MIVRQAVSLLLAFSTGVLLPVVCVPDAVAPPGHGWHLVVEQGATHVHRYAHDSGDRYRHPSATPAANQRVDSATAADSSSVHALVPTSQGNPRSAGLPDVAAAPRATRSDPMLSMAPTPSDRPAVLAWILTEDLSPPPRHNSSFSA